MVCRPVKFCRKCGRNRRGLCDVREWRKMTMYVGHHRTWGTENTTKTDITSALVRSVAGTARVTTVCVRRKDGAGVLAASSSTSSKSYGRGNTESRVLDSSGCHQPHHHHHRQWQGIVAGWIWPCASVSQHRGTSTCSILKSGWILRRAGAAP